MNIIICEDYEEMSAKAAEIVADGIRNNPELRLGLATGSTPVGMYDNLAALCNDGKCDFSKVVTFNLDEYYPITPDNPQSYRYFMDKNLFDRVNIDKKATHVPDGTAKDTVAHCKAYDEAIKAAGGVDIQVIGIGPNGHIGFNEPDDYLVPGTHLTDLTESTLQANSRFFSADEVMPTKALTMGIGSILSARQILCLASGKGKHPALKKLTEGNITTKTPVTFLHLHDNVTIICDKEAYYGE